MPKILLRLALILLPAFPALATSSYYPARLEDAKAIYLTQDSFPVHGDGVADDSEALQQAIDWVQETTNQGILFSKYAWFSGSTRVHGIFRGWSSGN